MARPISLKDLAKELGISVSTVSRALKDSPEISLAMRQKIKALAEQRNYRPNPFAVSLLKNTPRIIGIIVPNIVTHFYSSIISGINDIARQNNYSVIITSSYEQYELEKHCLEELINIRVEGIAICLSQETNDYSHFDAAIQQNVPLVFFDRVCLIEKVPSVMTDNVESAQIATQHLLDTGSRHIAFIGGANHMEIVRLRKHGYLQALRENSILIQKELVYCKELSYEEGYKGATKLLSMSNPPDAILAMNDDLTFGAMKAIKAHGFSIPEDIALIGYTDEAHSNYVEPSLTAVTHQTYKMGETVGKLLLEQVRQKVKPQQIIIPSLLKIRESSIKNKKRPV